MKTTTALSLCVLLLSGCTSAPERTHGAEAFIRGSNRETSADWASFYFKEVDGRRISVPSYRRSWTKPVRIEAGPRSILLHFEGGGTLSRLPDVADAVVALDLTAGIVYEIDGKTEGQEVVFWITRVDTGQRVTQEVRVRSERYRVSVPLIITK
jgi:hypothetical protein